jgi:AraC-like DNA-binding protein
MLTGFASASILVAAILTYYTALLHLTRRSKKGSYTFRILRGLLVGTQTLQLYFIASGAYQKSPFLLYPFVTLLFLTGPLNYIRYFKFFYPEGKIPGRLLVQILPAALVLSLETWFYFFSASQSGVTALFSNPLEYFATYVLLTGVVVALIQHGSLLRLELGFASRQPMREPVQLSSGILVLYMLNTLLIALGFVLTHPNLMHLGIFFMGIAGIAYLLFENRYPDFYQMVAFEQRQEKYKKSLIQGLSRDKILNRLGELMEEEKIYQQPDLKLDEVAARLYITPHQLSEFVNDSMGMNFASYINHYRVEEARKLLLENPEESILAIGFQVGFGSKQSFNHSFKQQTGLTPSAYRKGSHCPEKLPG